MKILNSQNILRVSGGSTAAIFNKPDLTETQSYALIGVSILLGATVGIGLGGLTGDGPFKGAFIGGISSLFAISYLLKGCEIYSPQT